MQDHSKLHDRTSFEPHYEHRISLSSIPMMNDIINESYFSDRSETLEINYSDDVDRLLVQTNYNDAVYTLTSLRVSISHSSYWPNNMSRMLMRKVGENDFLEREKTDYSFSYSLYT